LNCRKIQSLTVLPPKSLPTKLLVRVQEAGANPLKLTPKVKAFKETAKKAV